MIANALVRLWLLAYGRFRVRGVGGLIRLLYPWVAGLKAYPLEVPGVGTVLLDFGMGDPYLMLLRLKLRDLGNDCGLYRAVEKFIAPGAVLWDVGAYVGYFSAYFADPRFQIAAIHSFEPNPASIAQLQTLFARSSVVKVHPFGLGNTEKSMALSVTSKHASMASLVRPMEGGENIPIHVKIGDTARQELSIPLPDIIKIDVEGFEGEVLAGLGQTISRKRPVIFFEHIFLSNAQIEQAVPPGYQVFFIGDDGLIYQGIVSREKGHDAILAPSEKIPLVNQLPRG